MLKKAPLADQERWFNPDLKAYATDVCIDGTHEFLKTGMTAKVEITIKELKNVISVPIQVVVNREGKKICYVESDNGPQVRVVQTGEFNNNFVEIKSLLFLVIGASLILLFNLHPAYVVIIAGVLAIFIL